MEPLKRKSVTCPIDKNCAQWARKYMGYCLCSRKDEFSLALGLISVMSWGVAEIPQIITNYKQKSAEGLSTVFLLTWIIGDLFNLFGCILEPATLPTQYYMAILYLATTVTLAAQALYYQHIYPRLKSRKRRHEAIQDQTAEKEGEHTDGVEPIQVNNLERSEVAPSSPIPLPAGSRSSSHDEETFFMSARSLSVSHTPTLGSFPAPRTPTSDAERWSFFKEPLLGEDRPTQSAPAPKTKTMLCVVSFVLFFIGSCNRQVVESRKNNATPRAATVLRVGRRFLWANLAAEENLASASIGIGSYLGWGMAVIYLGGRLPQICLNIRRGNAEGLNPLMFVFALVGNATYVASILISSLEWTKIRPNMPWLVDAGGCVLLDAFILIQFIYYRHRSKHQVEKYAS